MSFAFESEAGADGAGAAGALCAGAESMTLPDDLGIDVAM